MELLRDGSIFKISAGSHGSDRRGGRPKQGCRLSRGEPSIHTRSILASACLNFLSFLQYAAEMTAYDPTSGELRTHYAGFFDPGFGYHPRNPDYPGSRAALEVRAHDVRFAVEHGQNICKLSFDRMIERPDRLYGSQIDSNYQGQEVALSKHFKRDRQKPREERITCNQPTLFSPEEATGAPAQPTSEAREYSSLAWERR